MPYTSTLLFILFTLACAAAVVLALVLAEQRLHLHRVLTQPEWRNKALRSYIAGADAETICVIADALADRAKAIIDAGTEPQAFYVLSWVFSSLRSAQSTLRGNLQHRSLTRAGTEQARRNRHARTER